MSSKKIRKPANQNFKNSFLKLFKIQPSISFQLNSIIFTLILVLIVSNSFFIQKRLKNYLLLKHKDAALKNIHIFSKNISEFLKHPEKILSTYVSSIETLNLDKSDLEALLLNATLENEIFEYLSIIDINGIELVKTESDKQITNIKNQPFFQLTLKGEEYTSSVIISDEYYPFIIQAFPIFKLNKVTNIFYAKLNLKGIWEYIDYINTFSNDEESFFIISDNKILCAYEDKKLVFSNETETTKKIVISAIQAYLNPTLFRLDDKNEFLITSKKIEPLGYYLVYKKNFSSIIKEIRDIDYFLVSLAFLIIILAWFSGHWISKKISLPILKLANETKNIGIESLKWRKPYLERKDEIGILYQAFYSMNERIVQAKARERLAIIGESAMGISHEIKNPMTAMKNFIHLIINNPFDDEIFNEFKEIVPKEIKRIEDLISSLSDLSIGKPLKKEIFPIKKVIDESFKLYEKILQEMNIQYNITIIDPNIPIKADYSAMKSIFSNLILNSKESMKNDGFIKVSIILHPEDNNTLVIIFEDNGAGINSDIISKIFNPFYSTKCKGLGIGLAITKSIIEQHGGEITVTSEGLNKGTIFTIKMPIL